jgi:transmembrane sensor
MEENPYANMDKAAHRIAFLVAGYIRGTITEKDHDELDDWINASDHNMQLFEELTDEKNLDANLEWMDKVNSEHAFQQLQQKGAFKKPQRRFKVSRVWFAAASVILLVGLFLIYRFAIKAKTGDKDIVAADSNLKPGGNRATLTLADGSVIDLSDAKKGLLKKEQGSDISKLNDGELVYVADSSAADGSAIHTLSTPVGGQFQIKLSDGTKVWLNAATTLKYPAKFSSTERNVEVDGEAYFEVAKNDKQPFHVMLSDSAGITVLGTHFNVMSYKNEDAKEITLLEGSVSVSSRNKTDKLQPGMQETITGNDLTKRGGVDVEEITGWKDGQFVFHDATIESIMRQVERWYAARIIYQGNIKQLFNATISRSEPLSKLLHLLQLNGYVKFKIENKTVYVLP